MGRRTFQEGFPRGVHPPRPLYQPATGVFVRNKGKVGIVPIHPLDEKGKTPRNLEHGVFSSALSKGMSERITGGEFGQKWETLKSAPRQALTGSLVPAAPLHAFRGHYRSRIERTFCFPRQ